MSDPQIQPNQIQRLLDKQEIAEQLYRYCRAIDRSDKELLLSVFHEDSQHNHKPFVGPSAVFCDAVIDFLSMLEMCTHNVCNILYEFEDDNTAMVEATWLAVERVGVGVERTGSSFEDHDKTRREDLMVGGRYIDRFEKREGVWKIAQRTGVHDWHQWREVDDRRIEKFVNTSIGARKPDDKSYALVNRPEHIAFDIEK